MIDRKALLDDLKKLVTKLEKDLRDRCEENAEVNARVRIEYEKAKEAKRTAQAYKVWRDEWITQVAVAWVLGVVFVRFIEDNGLIAAPFIAGPEERLQFAKEQRTAFFQQNPTQSDREYLEHVFREVAKLPAMKELYDERHNPLWALGVSGDGAKLILEQFQKIDPGAGTLVHDFADPEWNTRFLGDLYQDLSEAARKKYALLQTPEFVEEFILDRTLDPAIAEFGLERVRMIDPTCGSGHFLLGAFARLFPLWEQREPGTNRTVLAQRTLDAVHGVDLNPYATAVSRFRLLLAAMKASGVNRLADCPDFQMNLATGDSLLHGAAGSGGATQSLFAFSPMAHVYETEDKERLESILQVGSYHAVVGNPPYITVKDPALNQAYRDRFRSCHRKYSLAAPFFERFFNLTKANDDDAAGFVGMITSNSFMKREFGKKLIESCLPSWDLTHVIDTSGAYIPGHSTPTVILFGRNQQPAAQTIRTVMGIKGEPSTPDDPASGEVWAAIRSQVDVPGSTSTFVSVGDSARDAFHRHPWSIGGGGAAELKELIEESSSETLGARIASIGFMAIMGEDEAFVGPESFFLRARITSRSLVVGDAVRDWTIDTSEDVLYPYEQDASIASDPAPVVEHLWPFRSTLRARKMFGKNVEEHGLQWWEYIHFNRERALAPLSVALAFVATHNHFVLDRGGKVFKQTAPIIRLPAGATEEDHLALLGLLNSSTACFWGRQTVFPKGGFSAGKWEERLEWDGTKLQTFPLATDRPMNLARSIDELIIQRSSLKPAQVLKRAVDDWNLEAAAAESEMLLRKIISLQEELDWSSYRSYGLLDEDLTHPDPPPIRKGERAFEIVLARIIRDGGDGVAWFERHDIEPITEIPTVWPEEYRRLVERRIAVTEEDANIQLIEQPEHKRRWNEEPWQLRLQTALREFLAARLEAEEYRGASIISTARIAARSSGDAAFHRAAELYRSTAAFDIDALVAELIADDSVPMLSVDRYKESGLRNRATWEETWTKQRLEDAIDTRTALAKEHPDYLTPAAAAQKKAEEIGDIAVPPKYKSADFKKTTYWSLRGKLDVPKERFISFPGCERESDPSLPVLWAGLDHLQQARTIAAYYQDLKENEAAGVGKLGKLLACILELLPWLKQWHNEIDPEYGTRMGDFFESFMHAEMAGLGLTMDDLRKIRGL